MPKRVDPLTKAKAIVLHDEAGWTYEAVGKHLKVGKASVIRWVNEGFDGLQINPDDHSLNEKLTAIREILAGGPGPDWMTTPMFLEVAGVFSSAENQHRMSQVRLTETALSRTDFIQFFRRFTAEVEKRFVKRDTPSVEHYAGLIDWARSALAEYNPVLSRDM